MLPNCGARIAIRCPHVSPCCGFAAGKRSDDIVQMKKEVMTVINKQMAKSGAAAAADDGGCSTMLSLCITGSQALHRAALHILAHSCSSAMAP